MKWIIAMFLIAFCAKSEAQVYNTKHFKIFYTSVDNKNIKEIADSLEGSYDRIIADLQCLEDVPVKVHFYADTPTYRQSVRHWAPNLPSWSGGITLGDSVVHMISPNAPYHNYREEMKNAIHEFAHCVSRRVNNRIANNPRWLWESIAIYESKQLVDPHKLPYLVNHKPPGLKQLSDFSDTTIYEVGYLVSEYLVETKDKNILNTLIKNNGNIKQTLNVDDEEFTRRWFAFVRKKYGI